MHTLVFYVNMILEKFLKIYFSMKLAAYVKKKNFKTSVAQRK